MRFSYEKLFRPLAVRTSHGIFPMRESRLVKIEDADGNFACGECAPWDGFGCETLAQADDFFERCCGRVPPEIPENLPCVAHAFSAAKFFLENPKALNFPEPENGLCAKLIRRNLEDSPSKILAEMDRAQRSGFSVFKIKIGLGDAVRELRFCENLLENAPSGTRIRFDANGAFSPDVLPELSKLSAFPALDFFEQPLPATPENEAKIFAEAERSAGRFALDESVREPWAFPPKTRVVAVVKPLLVADFPRLLAWLAEPDGARTVISTVFENSRAGTQALRLACAVIPEKRRCAFGLGF